MYWPNCIFQERLFNRLDAKSFVAKSFVFRPHLISAYEVNIQSGKKLEVKKQ